MPSAQETKGKGKSTLRDRIEYVRAQAEAECKSESCALAGQCSHEGERDAARNLLGRLMAKLKEQVKAPGKTDEEAAAALEEFTSSYGAWGHVYGPRYAVMRGKSLKEKAAQIKRDIMMARRAARPKKGGPLLVVSSRALAVPLSDPIGDAPEGIKFSVTSQYIGSGYSVIDIKVSHIPADWGWRGVEESEEYGSAKHTFTRWYPTRALKALSTELGRLHWAYNADHGSDLLTDLNLKSYNGGVEFEDPDGHLRSVDYSATAGDVLGAL